VCGDLRTTSWSWKSKTKRLWSNRQAEAGLPFGLFKGQICQFRHSLKLFARNKMVWPFGHFLAFLNVDKKMNILKPDLDKSEQISNILWNSKFWFSYCNTFWRKFGLFSSFRICPFWNCLWRTRPFSFFGPGNPFPKLQLL